MASPAVLAIVAAIASTSPAPLARVAAKTVVLDAVDPWSEAPVLRAEAQLALRGAVDLADPWGDASLRSIAQELEVDATDPWVGER